MATRAAILSGIRKKAETLASLKLVTENILNFRDLGADDVPALMIEYQSGDVLDEGLARDFEMFVTARLVHRDVAESEFLDLLDDVERTLTSNPELGGAHNIVLQDIIFDRTFEKDHWVRIADLNFKVRTVYRPESL